MREVRAVASHARNKAEVSADSGEWRSHHPVIGWDVTVTRTPAGVPFRAEAKRFCGYRAIIGLALGFSVARILLRLAHRRAYVRPHLSSRLLLGCGAPYAGAHAVVVHRLASGRAVAHPPLVPGRFREGRFYGGQRDGRAAFLRVDAVSRTPWRARPDHVPVLEAATPRGPHARDDGTRLNVASPALVHDRFRRAWSGRSLRAETILPSSSSGDIGILRGYPCSIEVKTMDSWGVGQDRVGIHHRVKGNVRGGNDRIASPNIRCEVVDLDPVQQGSGDAIRPS